MRNYYLIIIILLSSHLATAQINYLHDNAGNRIQRKVATPLPVTLTSFTATKVPGGTEVTSALLSWQTASETNSDRFEIERSQDWKKWINIGNVTANGDKNSRSSYSFSDKNPLDGENLYRLKMIDHATGTPEREGEDGMFSFSRIQSLNFEPQITFYPNPVQNLLKIKGKVSGTLQLISGSGQQVYHYDHIPANGIDMGSLAMGIYLIIVTNKDGLSIWIYYKGLALINQYIPYKPY